MSATNDMPALDLQAVVREVAPVVTGGRIQRIGEPRPGVVIFDIRVPGRTVRLFTSLNANHARMHVVTGSYPNPTVPPPLCRFLRARLLHGRIASIQQVNQDRIARIAVSAAAGTWTLVVELRGQQADLLLLDAQDHVIMSYRQATHRVGQTYRPPPSTPPDSRPQPAPPPSSQQPQAGNNPFPFSAALEERYGRLEEDSAKQQQARTKQAALRKTIKRHRRLLDALTGDLTKLAPYERYARYGELLKGALSRVQKGQSAVTLVDYFDERLPELTIPLDPAKTPQANLDDYFVKHKKFLRAQKEIIPRMAAIRRELDAMRDELTAIESGTWTAELPAPLPSGPGRLSRAENSKPPRQGPFRKFTSTDGLPIYVGRNARENDALTFSMAKSDDVWLHARGSPGSHVIIRLKKGDDPPDETLKDAATLALLYSDLKKSGQGEVMYTRRKWVRKAKGGAPGGVTVTQERSLFIRLDPSRLNRLKQRSV